MGKLKIACDKNGMALIEVLVAVGLFTLLSAAFFLQMASFSQFESTTFNSNSAIESVASEVEMLQNTPYSKLYDIADKKGGVLALNISNGKATPINSTYSSIISQDLSLQSKIAFPKSLKGVMYVYIDKVNKSTGHLLDVYVSISFAAPNSQQVIGEDQNLDGTLSSAEDKNTNGRADSPISLSTSIYDPL